MVNMNEGAMMRKLFAAIVVSTFALIPIGAKAAHASLTCSSGEYWYSTEDNTYMIPYYDGTNWVVAERSSVWAGWYICTDGTYDYIQNSASHKFVQTAGGQLFIAAVSTGPHEEVLFGNGDLENATIDFPYQNDKYVFNPGETIPNTLVADIGDGNYAEHYTFLP